MIHAYTGDGKGKTTAAVGLLIRAFGSGRRVGVIFFDKGSETYRHNELVVLNPAMNHFKFINSVCKGVT